MRKFLYSFVAMLTMIFVISMPIGVIADEVMDSWQTSEISYTVQGSYTIFIPMEISVGDTVDIYADQVNIPDGKMVTVSFESFETDNIITLTNPNSNDTVRVHFTKPDGTAFSIDDRLIGTFDNSSQGTSYSFSSYADYDTTTKAGTYTGNVNFYIGYVDAY